LGRSTTPSDLSTRIGPRVQRWPLLWVLGWAIVLALGAWLAPHLATRLVQEQAPPPNSDSAMARLHLSRALPALDGSHHLLVLSGDPEVARQVEPDLERALRAVPGVRGVQGATPLLVITERGIPPARMIPALRGAIRQVTLPPGVEAALTGPGAAAYDAFQQLSDDLARVEKVSLLISMIVLVLTFRGILMAALSLLSGLSTLLAGNLVMALLLPWLPVSSLNQIMVAILAMALGIDYPLILLSRLKEEHAKNPEGALARTLATAGRTVGLSSLVIALGGLSLLVVAVPEVRSIGLTVALTGPIAAALTLTLIPSALFLLGRYFPLASLLRIKDRPAARTWGRLSRAIVQRPRRSLLFSSLLLGLLILPIAHARTWSPFISLLPHGLESYRGFEWLLSRGEGGLVSPILVTWQCDRPDGAKEEAFLAGLRRVEAAIAADPRVARVESLASDRGLSPAALSHLLKSSLAGLVLPSSPLSPDGRITLMRVTTRLAPDSPEGAGLLSDLARTLGENPIPEARPYLGGMLAEQEDSQRALQKALPWVLGINLFGSYFLLARFLRSAILPIKAILTNLLPVLAGFGAVVAVFQYGFGAQFLGTYGNGYVQSLTPLILFSVLYAISLDYELFILARIREAHDEGMPPLEAIADGLQRSSGVVLGAALVMLSVFLPYLAMEIRTLKEIGLGLSVAILVDATLIRLVLVPSMMALMGRWNYWWPRGPHFRNGRIPS